MSDMPEPLIDAKSMRDRARDYGLSVVTQVTSLLMGGVFATAALSIADIVRNPDLRWVRLTLWLAGMVYSLNFLVASLHRNWISVRPEFFQLPLTVLIVSIIATGFALTGPATGGADGWRWTYASLLLLTVLTNILQRLELNELKLERYSADLAPLLSTIRANIARDMAGALPGFVMLGISTALAWSIGNETDVAAWALIALNIVGVFWIGYGTFGLQKEFAATIEGIEATGRTAPREGAGS